MKKAYRFSIGGICSLTILLAFFVSLSGQSSINRLVITGFKVSPPGDREHSPRLPGDEPTKTTGREAEQELAFTLVVNKKHHLTAEYIPPDLTVPKVPFSFTEDLPKKRMRKEAAEALEELFDAARREGIELVGVSAYRSYERQAEIFAYNARQRGEEVANQVSARPGESEHQTGLAIDVSCASVKYQLIEEFGETKEGKWLADHAAEYGFIIRYPKGKEEITGYQYEPWHLRYVGRQAAQRIKEEGITLEEYKGFK